MFEISVEKDVVWCWILVGLIGCACKTRVTNREFVKGLLDKIRDSSLPKDAQKTKKDGVNKRLALT